MHPEYRAVLDALRAQGIPCCVLRDELERGALVDDLDLLVASASFDRAIDVLAGLGYRLWRTERRLPLKSVLVKMVGDTFVAIDLHRTVVQNGIELLDGDGVLRRMPQDPDAYLPAPTDLAAILVLHNLVGKRRIQAKHLSSLSTLRREVDDASIRAAVGDDAVADIVLEVLEDPCRYCEDPSLAAAAGGRLVRRYREIDKGMRGRRLRLAFERLKERFRLRPRAPLYALLGVDGVGKSSLTQELLSIFERSGRFRAVTIYMGPWGHYLLPAMRGELFVPGWSVDFKEWAACVLRRKPAGGPNGLAALRLWLKIMARRPLSAEEKEQYASLRCTSRLLVTARFARSVAAAARFLTMLTAEMSYRYYLAWRHRRRGITVIADRYIFDLMTGRMHEMIPQYRRIRSLLCAVFPRPTRVFLLHNDPDVILSRKADLTPEMLERYAALYDKMAAAYGFEKIKTNRPPRELATELVASCFAELVRYGRA